MFKPLKYSLSIAAITLSALATTATYAAGTGTGAGWYYTAINEVQVNGVTQYSYASRGAFNSEDACWQEVNIDYGNNDGWLPYSGSPICTYRYENELGAYDDILDDWNDNIAGGGSGNGNVFANEEFMAKVKDLRKTYKIEEYRERLSGMIALEADITDPNHDEDEYKTEKR